ncbi:MAG: glutathione peroxidase [Roseburia hominis]|uniref:glutathione peroxidase n=1 Tax=Roseburia hominis TaxID=301301 RepID=UPI0026EC5481|nr:glutathione peroxidase [Roseburia hominis]MCI7523456.1 glutathione peroxidase [Roseburia hominis]MDD6243375.1 glutathione peroxidase [Roseburia hominis]
MGFDEEHPLAAIVESMLERTYPDYKETPDIKWNFTKFLIDRNGNVVECFEPTADMDVVREKIENYL